MKLLISIFIVFLTTTGYSQTQHTFYNVQIQRLFTNDARLVNYPNDVIIRYDHPSKTWVMRSNQFVTDKQAAYKDRDKFRSLGYYDAFVTTVYISSGGIDNYSDVTIKEQKLEEVISDSFGDAEVKVEITDDSVDTANSLLITPSSGISPKDSSNLNTAKDSTPAKYDYLEYSAKPTSFAKTNKSRTKYDFNFGSKGFKIISIGEKGKVL